MAAGSGVHEIELRMGGGSFGTRWPSGNKPHSTDDEKDSGPAVEGEVFVQPEAAEQSDNDVSKGRGGHDEGEVGPGERGHVGGEEADEQDDSGDDEGVEEGVPEETEMMEIDLTDLGHAAGEKGVSYGCGEHDGDEDGVLRRFESVLHLLDKNIKQSDSMQPEREGTHWEKSLRMA
jgi:hypothetical protein